MVSSTATTSRSRILSEFNTAFAAKYVNIATPFAFVVEDENTDPIGEYPKPWRVELDAGEIVPWDQARQQNNSWYPATVNIELIIYGPPADKRAMQNWVDDVLWWIRNEKPFGYGTEAHPIITVERAPRNLTEAWPYVEVLTASINCRIGPNRWELGDDSYASDPWPDGIFPPLTYNIDVRAESE